MKKELMGALVWAVIIIGLALAAKYAQGRGYIDGDTVKRLVICANGLWIAWYGNRIPKTWVPNAQARRARRVAGWSMVLSGLAYTALWALAPIPVAAAAGSAAVVAGIAVTLGYCLSLRGKATAA